jgi:hypothetical protein
MNSWADIFRDHKFNQSRRDTMMSDYRRSALVFIVSLITALQPAYGQCASNTISPVPTPPSTTSLDVTGNTGTYFSYYNGTGTETTGAKLSDYFNEFFLAGASSGTFGSGEGAFSGTSWPAGPPWPVNNSSSGFTGSGCTPGVNCDACASNSADCYNLAIPKWPAIGMRSSYFSSSNGFDVWGSMSGNASVGSTGQPVDDAFFWHQSPVFLGGSEYGIFYRETTGDYYFYFDDNSNCTDVMGNPICASSEGGTPSINTSDLTTCTLNIGNAGYSHFQVYIVNDSGVYKFLIQVHDQSGNPLGNSPFLVDPSSTSFPISSLVSAGGYVSFGISRYDPGNTMTYTIAPFIYAGTVAKMN